MNKSRTTTLLILILLGAVALKGILLAMDAVPFNADEAIVALMARHILQGARPWFFYGQTYMGSLDAYLIAGSFWLIGESVFAIRVVQTLLFTGTLVASFSVALRATRSRRTALLTTLLLAFPPVLLTVYTTATLGGYGEALLFGTLLLWLGQRMGREDRNCRWTWFTWGLLTGMGFWSMALAMVYAVPVVLWLVWQMADDWRRENGPRPASHVLRLALIALGFAIGSLPWWLGGGARDVGDLLSREAQQSASVMALLSNVAERAFHFVLLGLPALFGLRFPWSIAGPPLWLGVPALALYFGALGLAARRWRERPRSPLVLLWGMCAVLFLGFVLTPYGGDPSGRYFLPLYLPLSIFTAQALNELRERIGRWAWLLLGAVFAFNLVGTFQAALTNPPGITTQFSSDSQVDHRHYDDLIAFLYERGETRGYTNYWVAYPLAFLSSEEIILTPRLPYKADLRYTPRDNRYGPYNRIVEASASAVYVTSNHPRLDARLREQFTELEVDFQEEQISTYRVFYDLSRKVTPEALSVQPEE